MGLYQHFRPEEHVYIDRALEWIEHASERHQLRLTDFLDPRQAHILNALAGNEPDIQLKLNGGSEQAERVRAILAPAYYTLEQSDFELAVVKLTSTDQRFTQLKHPDVLGSILGLGVRRDKLGDIHLHDAYCHCVTSIEIAEFIHLHLQQVHRVQIVTEIIPLADLIAKPDEFTEMEYTVASMRLDAVLSEAARQSRAKTLQPIRTGACKVNWKVEQNPAIEVGAGDVISLKGFGRIRILAVDGPTRKGRMRVKAGKYL